MIYWSVWLVQYELSDVMNRTTTMYVQADNTTGQQQRAQEKQRTDWRRLNLFLDVVERVLHGEPEVHLLQGRAS